MSLLQNCSSIAFKYLSSVEIDKFGSNQHELHGAVAFKNIFSRTKQYLTGKVYYIDQNYVNGITVPNSFNTDLTWYDAREMNPNRTEYRFYYTYPISVFRPHINDLLFVSIDNNNDVVIIIINNTNIITAVQQNISSFTSYDYPNGSSYYSTIPNVSFLLSLF